MKKKTDLRNNFCIDRQGKIVDWQTGLYLLSKRNSFANHTDKGGLASEFIKA